MAGRRSSGSRCSRSAGGARRRGRSGCCACYPAGWRERYGDEFAELLRESLADGRGGCRLTLDVVRGALEAHKDEALSPRGRAVVLLTACWIPLFPQGLVALGFLAFDVPVKSWFLALYVPGAARVRRGPRDDRARSVDARARRSGRRAASRILR